MLLDDVMSELDAGRRSLLAERLVSGGQTLITATHSGQLPKGCEHTEVRVRDGAVSALALAA
jgi:recombinational DNA repair ATPase RecF